MSFVDLVPFASRLYHYVMCNAAEWNKSLIFMLTLTYVIAWPFMLLKRLLELLLGINQIAQPCLTYYKVVH